MLTPSNQCRVCKAVKADKLLLKRIYNSSYYVPHSSDSLRAIHRDNPTLFNYASLKNHVKVHQFISSKDYNDKMLAFIDKKAQKNAVRKAVKAVDSIQTIIDIGAKRLEDGEISVDTNQLIRASQVKMTHESKQKDQELATIEMVAHFLSGEKTLDRIYVESE